MKRGDIYVADLDPVRGREQAGNRRVLIVTPDSFNQKTGLPLILPITKGGNFARITGFTVSLMGLGLDTEGVVRLDQLRTCDLKARNGRRIEALPSEVLSLVLERLRALFSEEAV
jgi:mRNA-degrading endonuclease toxin of MazEF toxin-antitoxin module